MIPLLLQLKVTCYTEDFIREEPTHLTVEITEQKYAWILKMSRFVKRNKIYCIQHFDSSPDFLCIDEDDLSTKEYTAGTECTKILVNDNTFFWGGMIKHTNVSFESSTYAIRRLKELKKFAESPIEEMPKYVSSDDFEEQYIAKERLKKGV